MGLIPRQKQVGQRRDERPHDANKTAAACAEFNALFEPSALHEARQHEAQAQARAAAIAEVRALVERYTFEAAELGFSHSL